MLEAVVQRCSVKKVFLEISQNSQVFSCEFSEISKNTFLHRTPLVAASFISEFEEKYIYPLIKNKSVICLRYIDDTVMVRLKFESELKQFMNEIK